jgi:hypothetical protein
LTGSTGSSEGRPQHDHQAAVFDKRVVSRAFHALAQEDLGKPMAHPQELAASELPVPGLAG